MNVNRTNRRTHNGDIHKYFSKTTISNDTEKAMFAHIKCIILLNNPVSHSEDTIVRGFWKRDIRKPFNECLTELLKLVEQEINTEMTNAQGIIVFDAWTCAKKTILVCFTIK